MSGLPTSWHTSCIDIQAPIGAGAKRRLDLEQGLAKCSLGTPGAECRGTFGPFFYRESDKKPKVLL
jgi:hypothetical protein